MERLVVASSVKVEEVYRRQAQNYGCLSCFRRQDCYQYYYYLLMEMIPVLVMGQIQGTEELTAVLEGATVKERMRMFQGMGCQCY